jgi:hypothetical protein
LQGGFCHDIIVQPDLEREKMATSVYETVELELMDGTKIEMRPLKISLLREFMKKFDTVVEVATNNVDSMDVLVECAMIAMKQYSPELSEDRERFEDVVDIKMVYKIIEVSSGIKLDAEGNDQAAALLGTN